MDTVICDISALRYWGIPPVVRLLAAASPGDALLQNLLSEEELHALRSSCLELPFVRDRCAPGPSWRAAGASSRAVREAADVLSMGMDAPVDVLVTQRSLSRRPTLVRPRLWSAGVPDRDVARVTDELGVVLPAHALLQVAARATLVQTVLLATELCGSFAVYRPPECVGAVLQGLLEAGRLPRMGGWYPCVDREGRLTELWSRPPLIGVEDLTRAAAESKCRNGRTRLLEAAKLVVPGAASPFEARTGVLLGFSRRRGGEGHAGFEHNHRIALSREARALARRSSCYCDLWWNEGLDLECQSRLAHGTGEGYLSDADRATALELMGIAVLPVTYAQLTSEATVEALSRAVAEKRGVSWRPPTQREREAASALRREVLRGWETLLAV